MAGGPRSETGEERAEAPGWSSPNEVLGSPVDISRGVRDRRFRGNASVPKAWIGRSVEPVFISGASTEYSDGISRR